MHRRHSNRTFLTGGSRGGGGGGGRGESFTLTYLVSSLTSRYADCFLLLFYAIKTLEGSATTVRSVRGIEFSSHFGSTAQNVESGSERPLLIAGDGN